MGTKLANGQEKANTPNGKAYPHTIPPKGTFGGAQVEEASPRHEGAHFLPLVPFPFNSDFNLIQFPFFIISTPTPNVTASSLPRLTFHWTLEPHESPLSPLLYATLSIHKCKVGVKSLVNLTKGGGHTSHVRK